MTVVLAVIAIVLLAGERPFALSVAWLANIIGLADLLFNVANGARIGAADHVGAQWFVLAFGVPGMAVVHGLAFWLLISRRADRDEGAHGSRADPRQAIERREGATGDTELGGPAIDQPAHARRPGGRGRADLCFLFSGDSISQRGMTRARSSTELHNLFSAELASQCTTSHAALSRTKLA